MHGTQSIISCLTTLNPRHMMPYEQAANNNCPEKSGANVLLILGHFQKCLTEFRWFSTRFHTRDMVTVHSLSPPTWLN